MRGRVRAEVRRFAFCCTFRGLTPPRRYLALCPWSPDFPPRLRAAVAWPTPGADVEALWHEKQVEADETRGIRAEGELIVKYS